MSTILAWYFSKDDKRLRYDDNRVIRKGITHKVNPEGIECCWHGLHASIDIMDALAHAPGGYVWRVELSGVMDIRADKIAASERKYLYGFKADKILRKAARLFALECYSKISDFDKDGSLKNWLVTGDERYKAAADIAADSASRSPAYSAADSAAYSAVYIAVYIASRSPAYSAADSAARSAARSAAYSAADIVADSAARSAARKRQSALLTDLILAQSKERGYV